MSHHCSLQERVARQLPAGLPTQWIGAGGGPFENRLLATPSQDAEPVRTELWLPQEALSSESQHKRSSV